MGASRHTVPRANNNPTPTTEATQKPMKPRLRVLPTAIATPSEEISSVAAPAAPARRR